MPISTTLRNVSIVGTCAILASITSLLLQVTLRQGNCTPYFINFVYDLIGALVTGTLCVVEQTGMGLGSWKLLLANSMTLWLYQWASLHALKMLPLAVVAGLNSSINPIFGAIFSTLVLGERPTSWFLVVLVRNIAVIWLMLTPLIKMSQEKDDSHSQNSIVFGIPWTVLLSLSVGASMTLQRTMKTESPMLITFWGLAINTILWMPPGLWPTLRVPGLWPPTDNDGKTMHRIAMAWLPAAAIVGVSAFVFTTKALHMMELPAFVVVFGPVLIGMNCVHDLLEGNIVSKLTLVGLTVVILGLVMDVVLNRSMTDAAHSEPKGGDRQEVEIVDSLQDEEAQSLLLGRESSGETQNAHQRRA